MQQTKVPPLEETRAVIIAAKGEKWLKPALEKVKQQYKAVTDPAFQMWLVAKTNGIEVTEIKASSGGDQGEEISIAEITPEVAREEMKKDMKQQRKFCLTGVLTDLQYGTSSKNNPKCEFVITDGTAVAKGAAYKGAADNFAQAKVRVGDVVKIPYASIWAGHHNFDPREKNKLWWKFSIPPFGDGVIKLDADPIDYFRDLESDTAQEGMAVYMAGLVTHLNPRENELCSVCGQWYKDDKPQEHENCTEEDDWKTVPEITYEGTITSFNGQTARIFFNAQVGKPMIKVPQDQVQAFGVYTKTGGIQIMLLRKLVNDEWVNALPEPKPKFRGTGRKNGEDTEETESVPSKPVVRVVSRPSAPKAPMKVAMKPKPKAEPVEEAEEEEAEEEAEEEPAPAPVRRVVPKAPARPAPKPAKKAPEPEPEPEEADETEADEAEDEPAEEEEVEEAPKLVKRAKPMDAKAIMAADRKKVDKALAAQKAAAEAEAEDEEEDEASDDYVVEGAEDDETEDEAEEEEEPEPAPAPKKAGGKIPPAKVSPGKVAATAKPVPKKAASGGSDPILDFFKKSCTQYGGKQRVFVLARTAGKLKLIEGAGEEEWRENIAPHIDAAIEAGKLAYADEQKQLVKWVG